ncbi:MAG: hypothetical protein U0414_12930 [Polyangiaceae bacterium]
MQLTIEIRATPRVRRAATALFLIGTVGFVANAHAGWATDPSTWIDTGKSVSSSKFKDLVGEIDARLVALETAPATKERVLRASFGGNGGAPTIATESWVSANHPSTGVYQLAFQPNFSTTPSCVASVISGNQVAPSIECFGTDIDGTECRIIGSGIGSWAPTGIDSGFALICVGGHP